MNSNYEKRALINTTDIKWQIISNNVSKKVLSLKDNQETSLIKLN